MNQKLTKFERLSGLKNTEQLFAEGKSDIQYPFRMVALRVNASDRNRPAVRILVSVSKKKFKKAVDRNRIKRLIREAYRLNKTGINDFAKLNEIQISIAFQYLPNEILPFSTIQDKMILALAKIEKLFSNSENASN